MKTRNLCALLLALMLLALAGCGQKEQPTQPENPDVPQEEAAAPVRLVCSNGSTTLRFSREEDGHWLWTDDKTFPLDESYALTLLETVQGIESLPPVTTAAQLADYGLESSAKYVTLTDSKGESVTYRLGSESDGSVYVYREGAEATVYAVPDLLGQIGRSIYDMMALPELPHLTAENVTSLTVTAGERILTGMAAEGAWTADGRDVTDQLADLTAWLGDMHLAACVDWRPSAGAAALCGLDKPAVTLTAAYTHAGADRSLTLTVGGQRGAGYCVTVSDDDTVYLMSAEALAPLLTLAQSGLE